MKMTYSQFFLKVVRLSRNTAVRKSSRTHYAMVARLMAAQIIAGDYNGA